MGCIGIGGIMDCMVKGYNGLYWYRGYNGVVLV